MEGLVQSARLERRRCGDVHVSSLASAALEHPRRRHGIALSERTVVVGSGSRERNRGGLAKAVVPLRTSPYISDASGLALVDTPATRLRDPGWLRGRSRAGHRNRSTNPATAVERVARTIATAFHRRGRAVSRGTSTPSGTNTAAWMSASSSPKSTKGTNAEDSVTKPLHSLSRRYRVIAR